MKKCCKCGKEKSIEEFCKDKNSKDGRCFRCKVCHNEANKNHIQKVGKDIHWKSQRETHYRQRYGITVADYLEKLAKQNNLCAICLREERRIRNNGNKTKLCVDHDHVTGKVRDLLCHECNMLLGNADESILILQAAIDYLKRHAKEEAIG